MTTTTTTTRRSNAQTGCIWPNVSRPFFTSYGQFHPGRHHTVIHSDRSVHRTSGLWTSRYRTHSTLPNTTTVIPPSAKRASSGVWKGKHVRHFSCQAHAIRYSDAGQTNHIPPSTIVDRFVNGEPLPNSSQLVDIKTAWSAFMELRKRSVPPQPSVVLGFVDRALSTVEGTLVHEDKTRELVRWSARLRRVLKQLGDIEHLPPDESVHVSCLLTRIQALLGRFDDVASSFPRIWHYPANEEDLDGPEFRMVETVLQALFRHRGPVAVLDFIVSQWHTLGRLIEMASSRRRSRARTKLGDIAFRIFDSIPSPLAVIAEMHGKPGKTIRHAGLLLIRFLVRRRVPEDALAVYREMQRQSVDISPLIKLWLVRVLVHGHAFEQANTLFSEISASVPSGSESELFLATALHLFSSQGEVSRSEATFKTLEDKNLVDYRVIGLRLFAHARNGDVETVLRYFHHHFPPNAVFGDRPDIFHYTAVLMAHARACDSSGLNKWFGNMIAEGLKPDRHVYNILMDDCIRRGKFEDAASIIEEMRIRQLPPLAETYTTIIAALAKRRDPVMAEAYYRQALREGVKPDRQMVSTLMTAHSAVGSWKGVIRAFDYLTSSDDRHLRPRIDVYNILLNAYVLAGSPFEIVSDVFQRMEQSGVRPTVHTFSILIKSAVDAGQMDVAMRVFMELDSLAQVWETGFKVNVYALTILMAGYLRLGHRSKAREIYDEMLIRGISPSSVTYGTILRAYVAEDRQENIRLAFDFMESLMKYPGESQDWLLTSYSRFSGFENIYSPLMTLFARRAKPEQVEKLMDEMVNAGGERTLATLTLLLNAYRNAGNVDECRRVWDEILSVALRFFQTGEIFGVSAPELSRRDLLQRKANIICVPLSIHMDALSAAGAHADVAVLWKTIREHGFATDSHNWNHLIVVLVRAGEIERAFQILERVIIPSIRHQQATTAATATARVSTAAREPAPPTPLSFDQVPQPQEGHDRADYDYPSTLAAEEAPRSRRSYLSTEARESVVAQLAKEREGLWHHSASTSDSSAQSQQGRSPLLPTADFAHPLYILQQILPSWDTWQPHAAVVTLLTEVLDHLEAGHMIQPIPPRRFGDAEGSTWQGPESEALVARELLRRIHASCPRAVTIVKEYDYRVRVRRELAKIVDED
jgi:pentatricopeptide repeat-containing protein PET309